MIGKICVYCASSDKVDPVYFEAVDRLAGSFAEKKIEVVYGGGATGLMGRIADEMIRRGGHVIGIMPNFMKEVEWAHRGVPEFHFVGDMAERKKKFLEISDALVALPGGCGTLEELFEAITLKRLGLYTKPIIILNVNHFYDPLEEMLEQCIRENFMSEKHRDIWQFVRDPEAVLPAIESFPEWPDNAIQFAKV